MRFNAWAKAYLVFFAVDIFLLALQWPTPFHPLAIGILVFGAIWTFGLVAYEVNRAAREDAAVKQP